MKTKTKNKNKSKKVVKMALGQTKPSEGELTLRHTDLQTNMHTPAHTHLQIHPYCRQLLTLRRSLQESVTRFLKKI